jgi:hypothetical protein
MLKPTHLSLFAINRANGQPIAGAPFYAEVVAPMVIDEPPAEVDHRFDDFISRELAQVDSLCSGDEACRKSVMAAIQEALSHLLAEDARDRLARNSDVARRFIHDTIDRAEQAGGWVPKGGRSLKNLADKAMRDAIDKAVRDVAAGNQLALAPETATPAEKAKTAYPLGILATNHVGYLSFDLTRLSTDVYDSLVKALEVRRGDSNATLDVSVWFYALAREDLRFDALAQGRFSEDAIVAKLELEDLPLPPIAKAVGFLSMQNPSLTDWRLSPSSFAANPSALIGDEEGCETLLPAHVALQEFYFYQVIRLNDRQQDVPHDLQKQVRLGVIHEYRLAWYPLGHSLGQILYSLPLAPGESVNLAVIDWTRRDDAQRAEHTTMDEQLVHNEHRDRTITETVNAAVDEYQHGSSIMGGLAGSAGASGSIGIVGIAAGATHALGGSSASSSGSRNVAGATVQKLSDNISQASASKRELQSTVVVHSVQAEKEAIETRTVVNYNHSHALTILYYEVLRHFRVVTERVRSSAALLVYYDQEPFAVTTHLDPLPGIDIPLYRTYTPFLRDNRALLKACLLDQQYAAGFDALERIEERNNAATHSPALAPANEGDKQFVYFTILTHTGGYSNSSVALRGILYNGPKPLIDLVRTDLSGPGDDFALQSFGSFADTDHDYISYAVTKDGLPRKWSEVRAILLRFGGVGKDEKRLGINKITVTGSDMSGVKETLVDWSGDYIFTDNTDLLLETKHPAPAPPSGPTADEIKDQALVDALLDHLEHNKEYYSRIIWLNEDPLVRASRFDDMKWDNSSTLLDHIENRAVEIIGRWVAFPTADENITKTIQALDADDLQNVEQPPQLLNERLVSLPTRGVFAEAKLGHCNASEEIDNTRFWDWQQSPIPHLAPEIAPVTPVTPQPQQPNLAPTPFPQSLVNIVNPPAAPDPTGLAAAFNVLATPNIFRDMSGQAEVADLLKKLSDNSVSIAEASNQARAIQSKYGGGSPSGGTGAGFSPGSGGTRAGFGSGSGGTLTGGGTSRPTPSEQHDQLQVLRNAESNGDITQPRRQQLADAYLENAATPMTPSPNMAPFLPPPPPQVPPNIFDFTVKKADDGSPGGWMETSCLGFGFTYKEIGQVIRDVKIPMIVGTPTRTTRQGPISIRFAQTSAAEAAWMTASSLLVALNNGALIPNIDQWFRNMMQEELRVFIDAATVSSCSGGFKSPTAVFDAEGGRLVVRLEPTPLDV